MTDLPESWECSAVEVWAPTGLEMVEIDRQATASGATEERTLIEAAGREIAGRICAHFPRGPVCVLVGSGHNGADGVSAGRTLLSWGRQVRFIQAGRTRPTPDASAGWPIPLEEASSILERPPTEGILLDGILGTGTSGAPRPDQAKLIEEANRLDLPVVSIDGPSGADMTSGGIAGACIRARLTLCLGWPKYGLLCEPARSSCGRIEALEIGFPPIDPEPDARLITARWVRTMLQPRAAGAHKGTSGYLLLAAGDRGMAGASILAARAAYRAGAGIVRLVGHPDNREIVQTGVPGAVFESWTDDQADAVAWAHALAIGPGLGRGEGSRQLVEYLLSSRGSSPAVVDADGLNAFEGDIAALSTLLTGSDVVTPHAGEMARLLGCGVAQVVAEPRRVAREAAAALGCIVVLKGAPTLVIGPEGPVRVATTGGPALAVGGTGDVLTGAIGALLAGGSSAADAASIALLLTGAVAQNDVGTVAEDIPDGLPQARRAVEGLEARTAGSLVFVSDPGPSAR
jgi:NAD(P)H-hydrate epimerase